MYYILPTDKDIQHHGVLGMKWGVRRYQNKDGSLTARGKRHYGIGNNSGVTNTHKNKHTYAQMNTNKSGTSKRGDPFHWAVNLRETNKMYHDNNNCSLCTFAFDLRNRGMDVRAGGYDYTSDGKTNIEISSWYEGGRRFADNNDFWNKVDATGTRLLTNPDINRFKNELLSEGEGTSGHMTFQNTIVDYKTAQDYGYSSQFLGGHDVFYKVENGDVYIYDAQSGKKMKLEDYVENEGSLIKMYPMAHLRTDDLTPREDALTVSDDALQVPMAVAPKTKTPIYNYSPSIKANKLQPTSVLNYTPPYKTKSGMEEFIADAKGYLKYNVNLAKKITKARFKVTAKVIHAIVKVATWGIF